MSRRLPLDPDGRRQRTDPSFQPGSTRGRIGNASPIGDGGGRGRVRPTSPGNTGPGGGVQFFDQFDTATLSAAGAQSKVLTYLPLPYSEHVFLNGVRQARGVGADFTITGQVLNVLTGMDARVGDVLAIEYAYSGAVPVTVAGGPLSVRAVSTGFVVTGSSISVVIPASVVAGDLLVVSVAHFKSVDAPVAWTNVLPSVEFVGSPFSHFHGVWRKVAVAGDAGSTATFGAAANDSGTVICVALTGQQATTPIHSTGRTGGTANTASYMSPVVTAAGATANAQVLTFWVQETNNVGASLTVDAALTSPAFVPAAGTASFNHAAFGSEVLPSGGNTTSRSTSSSVNGNWSSAVVVVQA